MRLRWRVLSAQEVEKRNRDGHPPYFKILGAEWREGSGAWDKVVLEALESDGKWHEVDVYDP